jgi:hypothetical protein
MSLGDDVDLEEFVTTKDDLSGADIKAVCTEAGLLALRERRMRVTKQDFATARERVRPIFLPIEDLCSFETHRCWTARRKVCRKACIFSVMFSLCRSFVVLQYIISRDHRCVIDEIYRAILYTCFPPMCTAVSTVPTLLPVRSSLPRTP